MGRLVLQLMISTDGRITGPDGQLDWIAGDGALFEDHIERATEAAVIVMAAGLYGSMPEFWAKAAADESAPENVRRTGKAVTDTPIAVYSHEDMAVKPKDTLHITMSDEEFIADIKHLKESTDGLLVSYGGVRMAQELVKHGLADEIHLDVCPVILGGGQPLFTDGVQRTDLKLVDSAVYESGAAMLHYALKG